MHPNLKQEDSDDEEVYDYNESYAEWWEEMGFSVLTTAWTDVVLASHVLLWIWLSMMFGTFMWQGWFPVQLAFYIEHILSNFNWLVVFLSANALFVAALEQNDMGSWISFVGYSIIGYLFLGLEYEYGTEAIRYLNNDYYKDPYLLPSILYLLGFRKHKVTDSPTFDQPSVIDDIPIDKFYSTIAI